MKFLSAVFLFAYMITRVDAGWLPREVHEVRAYVYDYTQEKGNVSLLRQGRLHRGIIDKDGAKLSAEQVERLKGALRSSEERRTGAFCYMPHHGFVFFDIDGKAMGHIELCFQCGNVANSPGGLPEREWDWEVLRAVLKELNVPILKTNEDYTKLYRESRQGGKERGMESRGQ